MRRTEYKVDPATLKIVRAPKWHDRLLEALTRAVASMVEIQKFIK